MTSKDFYRRFRSGELGDDMDFVEWSALGHAPGNPEAVGQLGQANAMTPAEYVDAILAELVANSLVASFDVIEQWVEPEQGYIRVRARVVNGDFLELAEYFVEADGACVTQRYRYQWMDATRLQLRHRWDNVEHFPNLAGFPHHVHLADGQVVPSTNLSIVGLLSVLATKI